MEEPRAGHFFRREDELHQTSIGRVLWRHVRPGSRVPSAPTEPQQNGYETTYEVIHGYTAERSIEPSR
ncbi:MAG: hypothetical protein ACT443_00810 [Gemmatimonadota bacterium]